MPFYSRLFFYHFVCKAAQDDLTRATQELITMKADYGDVVPRRDFYILEENFEAMKEKLAQTESDYNQLKEEHTSLLDIHEQVNN